MSRESSMGPSQGARSAISDGHASVPGRARLAFAAVGMAVASTACGGAGSGLPTPAAYAAGLPPDRIAEICHRLDIGNFYDLGEIRSDLRDTGSSEAEIEKRASEILTYIDDEKC